MILIKKVNKKKTLTDHFLDMEASATIYKNAIKNKKVIENAKNNMPLNAPNYYKTIFIDNYEKYYKKGGKRKNKVYDNLYSKLIGNDPLDLFIKKSVKKEKKKKEKKLKKFNLLSKNVQLKTKKEKFKSLQYQIIPYKKNELVPIVKEENKQKKKKYKLNIFKKLKKDDVSLSKFNYYQLTEDTAFINHETGQVEIQMSKEEFNSLDNLKKSILKKYFYFSPYKKRWLSKARKNPTNAIRTARNFLDFKNFIHINKYAIEEQKQEIEKKRLLARLKKYENIIKSKRKKADEYMTEYESYRGDISYWTQPIIRGHARSEAFGRRRERVVRRYEKGLEELNKVKYYENKIEDVKKHLEQFNKGGDLL